MNIRHVVSVILISCFMIISFSACSKDSSSINCPFTEMSWEDTTDRMISLEGDGYDTYDSIYKGLTYTYPKEYLGNTGMIKYMYDGNGKLCNVSWSYTGDSEDDVMEVYRAVVEDMNKLHGNSTNDDGVGNYCEMWISSGGTVMANAVITNDTKVMQIAYMSADVSKQPDSSR